MIMYIYKITFGKYINLIFFDHPHEHQLSYLQHFYISSLLSLWFFVASIKAIMHAILPILFKTSSSDTIKQLQCFIDSVHKKEFKNE